MADGAIPPAPWEKRAIPPAPWEKAAPPAAAAVPPPAPWEVATPVATEDVPEPEDFPTLFPTGNEVEPPRSYDYSERSPVAPSKPQFGPPEPPSMLSQILTEGASALATGATQQGVTTAYGLADVLVPPTPGTTAARPEIEAYFGMSPEDRLAYRVELSKDNSATAQMLQMIFGDIDDGAIRSMEELDAYNTLPPAPEILPMRQRPLFKAARDIEAWQERNLSAASPDFESGAGGAYRGVMGGLGQIATQIATALGVGVTAGPAAATGVTLGSSLLSGLGETVQEIYSKPNVAAAEEFQRGDQGVQPGLSSPPMADILTGRGADQMAGMSSPGLETEMQRRVDTVLDERLKQARNWGLAAGGTELAPLETLLNGIPGLANAGRFARVLMQGALEGGQEAIAGLLQNTGTGRQITAYLAENAGVGGTVGAIAQMINEMFIPGKQRSPGMGVRTPAEIAQLGRRTLPSRGGRLDPDQYDLPMELPEQLPPGGIQPELPLELPEQQAPAPGQEQYELPLDQPPAGTAPAVQSVPGPAPSEVTGPVTREEVDAASQAWDEAKANLPLGDPRRDAALARYAALAARYNAEDPLAPPATENAPATLPGPPEGASQVLPTNAQPPAPPGPPGEAAVPAPTEATAPPAVAPPAPTTPPGPTGEEAAPAPAREEPTAPLPPAPPAAGPPVSDETPTTRRILGPKPVEPGDVLSLVRSAGGVKPTGNLRSQNAPLDILNRDGKTIDEIRERMEAEGYFPPQDPDQPHAITDDDAEQMIIDAIGGQKIYSQHATAQADVQVWEDYQERKSQLDEVSGEITDAINKSGRSDFTNKEIDEAVATRFSSGQEPADILNAIVARRGGPAASAQTVPTDDDADYDPFAGSQAPVASRPGADGQDQLFVTGTDREETKGVKVKNTKELQKQLMAGGQAAITPRGERFSVRNNPMGGVILRRQRQDGEITESQHDNRERAANAAMKVMNDDAAKSRKDATKQQDFGDTGLGGFEGTQTEAPVTQAKEPEGEPKPAPDTDKTVRRYIDPTNGKKTDTFSQEAKPEQKDLVARVATAIEEANQALTEMGADLTRLSALATGSHAAEIARAKTGMAGAASRYMSQVIGVSKKYKNANPEAMAATVTELEGDIKALRELLAKPREKITTKAAEPFKPRELPPAIDPADVVQVTTPEEAKARLLAGDAVRLEQRAAHKLVPAPRGVGHASYKSDGTANGIAYVDNESKPGWTREEAADKAANGMFIGHKPAPAPAPVTKAPDGEPKVTLSIVGRRGPTGMVTYKIAFDGKVPGDSPGYLTPVAARSELFKIAAKNPDNWILKPETPGSSDLAREPEPEPTPAPAPAEEEPASDEAPPFERLEERAAPPAAAPADPMAKLREALAEIQGMLNAQTQPAPDTDTEPEQADMATLWGGDEEHIAAQDAATRETATLNSRIPRGGPTKSFLEASTSTDMPMNERSAYADAGADPNETLAATPEVRIATLIDLFKTKFGFKDVNRQGTYGTGNALQVIDHLVDGYRAIRMMMHVLGLPETGGSINGFISLVIGRKTKRSSFLGSYDPDNQSIELVGRSNSFAHEWMHALDQWLMQTVNPLSDGFLSRWTRTQGIDPAVDLEGHFINVMNAIFFDDAHLATRVLDLQIKAAQVYNPHHPKAGQPTVAAKDAQRLLDDIAQGKSRLINERSDTYKQAKRFGKGNSYWTNPAEMLARAFEAYVADKTARIDPDFKSNFIHKGEAAYHTAAATDPRLKETYPQDADKARIFVMLDNLLAEVALRTSLAGPTSAPPTMVELLDDNAFYAHGARETRDREEKERQRTIVARLQARLMQTTSLTGLRELRTELVESVQTRLGPSAPSLLAWGQWLQMGLKTFFQSEAAVAEMIVYRPQNKAAQPYLEALAKTQFEMSPGSGRYFEETFTEATEASIRKYAGLVGDILTKHGLPINVPHNPLTAWAKAQRASRDRINTMMTTGVKPPGTTDAEVDVAGALRRIYDEFWREANRVGMNIGYVEDTAYQPVIPDMGKVNVDEDGFVRQATKLYSLVFGRAVGLPGHAREAKVDEAITDLQQSTKNSDLLDPAIVALRSQLKTLDQKIAKLEGAQAAATDPKVVSGIEAQLKTLTKDKQDRLKQLATELQPRWAAMKAQQWHDAAVKGEYSSAQMDTLGPQTRHTKERVLPPEAQQIMKDYLVADPIDAMVIYMSAMSRKIEYARRLGVQSGGDQDFEYLITRPNSPLLEEMEARGLDRDDPADRVKAIMTLTDRATANRKEMLLHEAKKARAVPEDLRALAEQIEVMTGKRRDGVGPYMRAIPNAIHTVGTLALLPRSMLTSLAEPLTVMARTGDVKVAWEVMKHYGKEVFNAKDTTVQDVRDLATGIGLIASEAQDAMIQTTLAATPLGAKSQRILASFFERIGQAGLTRVQKRAVMVGYELWLKKLLRIAQGTDPGDKAVARANLADLGIPAESIQMLDSFLHAGTTRFLTDAELRTPMGQLWQAGARRFARSTIQSSDKGNKPRFANHPYGQLVFGLTSFAYNFTRNIMLRLTRQATRDYTLRRGAGESHRQAYLKSAKDNLLMRGTLGFAGLWLGQFLVSWVREFFFNNEQFNRHWEEGDLLEWMLGISVSRTGVFGAWDPVIQGIKGITYQRDITALTGGPYTNILLAAVQSAVMLMSEKNSPNTNTSERGFLREVQRLFVTPAVSLGISIAPGGPQASWAYAMLGMLGTSNSVNGLVSTWILGPPTPRGGGGGGVER